jgi:tight adherence protein B
MLVAVLAGAAAMICMLLWMSRKDYQEYELRRRINRMLLRQPKTRFSLFSFLGDINDRLTAVAKELMPGLDPDLFIIYGMYVLVAVVAIAGIMGYTAFGLAIDAFIVILTLMYLDSRRSSRMYKLEQQFGAFTRDVATYLHANANLYRAIQSVAEYASEPLKPYLDSVIRQVESGMTLDDALRRFASETNLESISEWVDSVIFARMAKSDITGVCEHSADRINRKLVRGMNIRSVLSKTKGAAVAILLVIGLMMVYTIMTSPDTKTLYFSPGFGQVVLMYAVVSLFITTYIIFRQIDGITKK